MKQTNFDLTASRYITCFAENGSCGKYLRPRYCLQLNIEIMMHSICQEPSDSTLVDVIGGIKIFATKM